jgi:hypothetical protein
VFSAVKRTVARGTADYADEKDAADKWKQHQCRTEGSQSVSSAVKKYDSLILHGSLFNLRFPNGLLRICQGKRPA